MKVHVEERRMVVIEVDLDAMVASYPRDWKSFLLDYEEDGYEARWDYLIEWIHETGLEDFAQNEFVNVVSEDSDLDVDAA